MPTGGSVTVSGYDIVKEEKRIRKYIASLPQNLTPFLYTATPFDYITTYLQVRGLNKKSSIKKCLEILEELEIREYANVEVGKLSGGNLRKVYLAIILSADADIYLLDEPTTGLDPISRHTVWAYLNKLTKKYNKSIILTSHYMDEIAMLSDDVLIINKGRLIYRGDPASLIKNIIGDVKQKIVIKEINNDEINVLNRIMDSYPVGYYIFGDVYYLYPKNLLYFADILNKYSIKYEVSPVGLEDVFFEVSKNDIKAGKSTN